MVNSKLIPLWPECHFCPVALPEAQYYKDYTGLEDKHFRNLSSEQYQSNP